MKTIFSDIIEPFSLSMLVSGLIILILALPISASDASECILENDRNKRLACYDKEHNFKPDDKKKEKAVRGVLSSNLSNSLGIAFPLETGLLEDDRHIEIKLSVKYPLVENTFGKIRERMEGKNSSFVDMLPYRLLFVYNGEYDFYVLESDRYQSAPIISRVQNPGLVLEWDFQKYDNKVLPSARHLRIGIFHQSNGQSLESNKEAFEIQRDELDGNMRPKGFEFALAQVSRSWNYFQFRVDGHNPLSLDDSKSNWWQYNIELRLFLGGRDEDLFWRDDGVQHKIRDYDGLRFMFEKGLPNDWLLKGEFKTGISDIDAMTKIGGKISIAHLFENTRVSLFYFNGHGKESSSYHLRQKYAGIELEFR